MTFETIIHQAFATVSECIALKAKQDPQQMALIHTDRRLSYQQLDSLMDRAASAMQREGLQPGSAIAICAPSSLEYVITFLGGLRAGLTIVPLSPALAAKDLAYMVSDSGAKLFFAGGSVLEEIQPASEKLRARAIALDHCGLAPAFDGWLPAAGAVPAPVEIEPVAPFNIIYSSGTTGQPKGIVQSHAMRWGHVTRAAPNYGFQATTLIATPLYSNTTLASFLPTIALGGTVVLMDKFDVHRYLALAEKYRVTHTMLVPVQYQRIMADPDFGKYDLSAFRMKYCTSAPFSATLKADILNRWPGGLVELYGMTEGGGTCVLAAHEAPHKLHTVGKPAPGNDIRVISDDGVELHAGEAGEIVGHSATMMTGYHNNPAKTAEAEWFDQSGKRFIRTGDIGRFDEDGFLVLLDRKEDVIISGGFNIYPSDLEAVIRQHHGVAETAVVGVPSSKWGETPVAFVVPRQASQLISGAVLGWANERVGKMQRLARVEVVDTLPRSPIGKVLKRELRDRFMEQAGGPL